VETAIVVRLEKPDFLEVYAKHHLVVAKLVLLAIPLIVETATVVLLEKHVILMAHVHLAQVVLLAILLIVETATVVLQEKHVILVVHVHLADVLLVIPLIAVMAIVVHLEKLALLVGDAKHNLVVEILPQLHHPSILLREALHSNVLR